MKKIEINSGIKGHCNYYMIAWIILKRAAFSGNNFNTGRNPKFPGQGNLMKSAGSSPFLLMA